MKRAIKAHKGGRKIKKSLDVTPATASLLSRLYKQHKLSLGDLVEQGAIQKAKELDMETNYSQINLKEWKSVNGWNNGESTYAERDAQEREEAHAEWQADYEKAGESGWHELTVDEGDVPSHQHGMEVKISGDGQFLYIRDVTQMMGADTETLYRRRAVTARVGWRSIPAQFRDDEGATFYIKREWSGKEKVNWNQYAYFANDCWCLDGMIIE